MPCCCRPAAVRCRGGAHLSELQRRTAFPRGLAGRMPDRDARHGLDGGGLDCPLRASYRDGRCKASVQSIAQALEDNNRPEHLFALEQAVALYDAYRERVAACDRRIDAARARLTPPEPPPSRYPPPGTRPACPMPSTSLLARRRMPSLAWLRHGSTASAPIRRSSSWASVSPSSRPRQREFLRKRRRTSRGMRCKVRLDRCAPRQLRPERAV
jgi:hypothetical protein